ncbi:hypothetical protein ACFSX5_18615 [Devosia albogilva]|uniref:Glycosyltransferase RgtA/B/C/D-like domain-containing protein n=1 Tax=Devosia albogilva TaxID=429726 RepID=A0ABW5QQU1_9HYPH
MILLGLFVALSACGSIWVAYAFAVSGTGDLFNTDLIQPYMIVRDTVIHAGSFLAWQYSPANYVFPDLFIAGLLYLVGVPWLWLPIAYAGVLLAAYGTLFGIVSEAVQPGAAVGFTFVATLILAAFLAAAASDISHPGSLLAIYLVSSYIHTGAILAGLVALALAIRCLSSTERVLAYRVLLVISVVTSFSDLLYLLWFVAPIAIVWLLLARARADRALRKQGIILVASSAIANLLDRLLRAPGGLERDIQQTIANLWQGFVIGPLAGDWVMAIVTVSTLLMALSGAPLLFRLLRRQELTRLQMALLMITGVQWAAIVAPAASGQFVSIVHLRYALPIFVLPVLWFMLLASNWLLPRLRTAVAWVGAAVLATVSAMTFSTGLSAAEALMRPHPVVGCVSGLGRVAGYSDYWLSKLTTFSTDYRMTVVPLVEDGSLHRASMNLRWLDRTADGTQPFAPTFVIMERLDPAKIRERFGAPGEVVDCGSSEVWLYDHSLPVVRP